MKAQSLIFLSTLLLVVCLWPDQKLTASTSQAEAQLSAPVRVSDYDGDDEDPSVMLARDGRFYAAWSSKRRDGVNIYIKSSEDGRVWSAEERVTIGPVEDYYPSLAQTSDGTFHIAWFRLERKQKDMDIWYSRSRDARTWTSSAEIVIARSRDGLNWSAPEIVSPPDEKRRYMDLLPFVFEVPAGKQLYLSWTSSRSGRRGAILLRSMSSEPSAYRLLTTRQEGGYDAKIAPAKTPGQYLMVWVWKGEGNRDIYSRIFHL